MGYTGVEMDQSSEGEKPETVEVVWRVLPEREFLEVLDYTIEQSLLQSNAGITGATEVISQGNQPHHRAARGELMSLLSQHGNKQRTELEAIRLLLTQRIENPNQPFPLDETTYPQPIFPLEHILREEEHNRPLA